MKNNQNSDICYVFSQATLDLALGEWLEDELGSDNSNSEDALIVAAAVPWFLKHLTQSDSIYMFTQDNLQIELKLWQSIQEAEYPHQKQRIDKACKGIMRFFTSENVADHKMMVGT